MNKIFYIIILGLIIICGNPLFSFAQVTIGSNTKANKGALLDLKETEEISDKANSTRGLALPRLKLTNENNLFPMFETAIGSGVANSEYAGALKSAQDEKHVGLVVYNLNKCNGFGQGTYVWDGKAWKPLIDVGESLQLPNILLTDPNVIKIDNNTYLYHLPSGKDLRSFPSGNKFNLNFNWLYPSSGNLKITDITSLPSSSSTPGSDGALKFANNTNAEGWANPVTKSPARFEYELQDMSDIITSDNPFVSNPFRSRETSVTFEVPANECYGANKVTVKLNQTNYRLTVKKDNEAFNQMSYSFKTGGQYGTGTNHYRLLITPVNTNFEWGDGIDLELQSNAKWKSSLVKTDYFSDVFTDMNVPERGGQEITNGAMPDIVYRKPVRNSQAANYRTRGEVAATMTFQDTAVNVRFYPIMIDFVQCSSDLYDEKGMTDVGRATGPWASGAGVLKHTDQSGRIFYSAEFGTAGRWMITNLAATKFDTGSNATKALSPYNNTEVQNQDNGNPKYAYPQTEGVDVGSTNWSEQPNDWRQTEGLFYNWYAASGRKSVDNANVEEGNTSQGNVQGICPNGWHLPSDKEWSQLEEVIHKNIGTYATYDQETLNENLPKLPAWSSGWNTASGERGAWLMDGDFGHGAAMKEICGIKGQEFYWLLGTKNYSKVPRLGGFNAMLAGRIKTYKTNQNPISGPMRQEDRYANGDYWSLSQKASTDVVGVSNTAWTRGFSLYGSTVRREDVSKTQLFSVRCKKN
ncbi:FISUMP domain-containing protein [Prevotella sp. 10(H)]|uniref:FISUMP domain-containing protein n=1 Tax=Prevotella sp. 10(H) TaxID=1158294 RepID=UPI0004A705B6|nr:FISUMP domain-containing protein [Prevotella sp. 10(H)]